MDGNRDKLLDQMTRIADALEFQQELAWRQAQARPLVAPDDAQTCKALIMAANRMGDSLGAVDAAIDDVNSGRAQSEGKTMQAGRDLEREQQRRAAELDAAVTALTRSEDKADRLRQQRLDDIMRLAPAPAQRSRNLNAIIRQRGKGAPDTQ